MRLSWDVTVNPPFCAVATGTEMYKFAHGEYEKLKTWYVFWTRWRHWAAFGMRTYSCSWVPVWACKSVLWPSSWGTILASYHACQECWVEYQTAVSISVQSLWGLKFSWYWGDIRFYVGRMISQWCWIAFSYPEPCSSWYKALGFNVHKNS